MDWTPVLTFLLTLAPWVSTAFMILGALVVIGITVDTLIPDEKDHGFMKKLMATPILGEFLEALKRFSPFNTKDKEKK